MTAETSNAREWVDLLERAVPFLLDEGAKYDDDGSNEPLELAREIETLLASLSSDESALSPASLAFDGGREATPCPHTRDTNCDCAAPPPPADAERKTLPVPTHVYLTDKAAVIVGTPERGWDDDAQDAHNCDAMGCATIGPHVLARVPFTDERALAQQPAAEEQLTYKGVPIGPMQTFADMERQASAPVGVEAGEVSSYDLAVLDDAAETLDRIGEGSAGLREARARIASALSQQPEARGVVDEGSRIVTSKLLHWGGIPVHVTGTVTTSPGNWPLIDAALTEARDVP